MDAAEAAEAAESLETAVADPQDPSGPSQSLAALPQDLVFVDLETTGGNAARHRITEIGIVRVEKGAAVEEWSSLVNPECPIPAYIERFTGISNAMVAQAPRFADIAPLVLEKLCSSVAPAPIFVAHNARFDYSFLRAEFRRLDVNFSAKVLCTVKLSRRLFPEHPRHSLDAVMERHALVCSARHRALGDARVLSEFWFKLRRTLPEAALAAAAQTLLGQRTLPAHLPADLADEMPEGPGVYRFFGAEDVLLYVGRSSTLRTRILEHFAGEHANASEQSLARQVRRVDWLETAGELGALLREAEWIKTQRPLYNRHRKATAGDVTVRIAGESGAVEVLAIDAVQPSQLTRCFGLFHSPKDAHKALADIARAQLLCLKALGLEEAEGSCVAHQIAKCKGACVGREPLALHNVRVLMALSSLKLKPWPFPGRVALRERDPFGADEWHVLDHWTYLGCARCEEELAALAQAAAPAVFDPQVYRILMRYLSRHPQLEWRSLGHSTYVDSVLH
jgi:DNA polymerase III subunit epsilon